MNSLLDTIGDLVRNLLKTCSWASLALLSLALTLGLVLCNYLATRTSLELMGFEQNPLRNDALLGDYFDAFLGGATLAHVTAALVAALAALGLYLVFHYLFLFHRVWRDRAFYKDPEEKRAARSTMQTYLLHLALLVVCLVPLIWWDLEMFRYRILAGLHQTEDPTLAIQTVQTWGLEMQQGGQLMAWTLVQVGTWGYLGLTAASCLGLEISIEKTQEAAARTWASVAPAQPTSQALYGYDADGHPVYEPDQPLAYDSEGRPLDEAPVAEDGRRDDAPSLEPDVQPDLDPGALFDPTMASLASKGTPSIETAPSDQDERHPVVGSATRDQVTLSEVYGSPERYHWDPVTRAVWDRAHWDAIHEDPAPNA